MATRNGPDQLVLAAGADDVAHRNLRFYDRLWRGADLIGAERFPTWPLVSDLARHAGARLEIAPGLRPRLPCAGTFFLDISSVAVARLRGAGGLAACGTLAALPYPDASFDLVAALDVVEHVADDAAAFRDLARVARPGARLLLAVPLHPAEWTAFDRIVGHCRRYEPAALIARLTEHGFAVEQGAAFGMQPRSRLLSRLGLWFLARTPGHAMRWYNRLLPLLLRRQKPLALAPGFPPTAGVSEVFLLCRRAGLSPP